MVDQVGRQLGGGLLQDVFRRGDDLLERSFERASDLAGGHLDPSQQTGREISPRDVSVRLHVAAFGRGADLDLQRFGLLLSDQ